MDSADTHSQRLPDPGHSGDPRHEPRLDTVAQKPGNIGHGAPASGPAVDAHRDNLMSTPGAQPPEETKGPALREPHRVAAGMKALTQSIKFTLRETGFTRGLGTWLKVNKKDGFDCQSCAWPSPDDHRHVFEFCENGVKALSSEATRKHIGPKFFQEHSISDLSEDSMGIIDSSRGHLEPASKDLRSEPAIIAGFAEATLGARTTVDWKGLVANDDRIRDHIEHVIDGFEDFNGRIRKDIFYLPNEARYKRKFNNGIGKAAFIVSEIDPHDLRPGEYLMMTVRSHDQFNTTIYGLNDRYRGVYNGRRVIFMNAEDVSESGLQQGQFVDLTSHYRGEIRVAKHFMVAPFNIPRGCTATYFPEANVLVSINSTADRSNTPTSKSVVISIASSVDATDAIAELRRDIRESGQILRLQRTACKYPRPVPRSVPDCLDILHRLGPHRFDSNQEREPATGQVSRPPRSSRK